MVASVALPLPSSAEEAERRPGRNLPFCGGGGNKGGRVALVALTLPSPSSVEAAVMEEAPEEAALPRRRVFFCGGGGINGGRLVALARLALVALPLPLPSSSSRFLPFLEEEALPRRRSAVERDAVCICGGGGINGGRLLALARLALVALPLPLPLPTSSSSLSA
jgi:hypothetical protein